MERAQRDPPDARRLNLLAGIATGALALFSAAMLAGEFRLKALERTLDTQVGLLGRGEVPTLKWRETSAASPRGQLATAIFLAREARSLPEASRHKALARARAAAQSAIGARPYWGEAWVALAYAESLSAGNDGATVAALTSSYGHAPFIKSAAPWRAQMGLRYWRLLGPQAQRRVIEEAVWIAMQDPQARVALFDQARKGPAYPPLVRRWHEARTRERLLLSGR